MNKIGFNAHGQMTAKNSPEKRIERNKNIHYSLKLHIAYLRQYKNKMHRVLAITLTLHFVMYYFYNIVCSVPDLA